MPWIKKHSISTIGRPQKTQGNSLVYSLDHPYTTDVETLFLRLQGLPGCVWLDSGWPGSRLGRYDILSALPSEQISDGTTDVQVRLNQRLTQDQYESELPFCGGWIGYFSYDHRHTAFKLSNPKPNPIASAQFSWYDWALVFDHQEEKASLTFLSSCPPATRARVLAALQAEQAVKSYSCSPFRHDESRRHYLHNLQRIQEYLLAGDCYQVNYTQRFSADFSGSPAAAYLTLRHAVPSPFSAFLGLPSGAVLSISPERFIQIRDRRALTQPIKGTSPRGKTAQEDDVLKAELHASPKNRAENMMIVDLLRNDFSMNCQHHSVTVPELFGLQSFNNVHHLVSSVEGTLRPHISHPDFILACFPGGSITGAPKKRSMEIIEELESHSRSIYCGAIGYFSSNGNSDFNIAIRTLLLDGNKLYAWAGGGIVADSVAAEEYEESLHKIGSLLVALTGVNAA